MADSEYGFTFAVYLTQESTIRFLTNESWIRLMDLVAETPKTISELSEITGMARSTVQSSLARLSEMGMLGSRRSGDDSRRVVFHLRCIEMVRSVEPSDAMLSYRRDIVLSIMERSGVPTYDVLFLLVSEFLSRGVDVLPMFGAIGLSMGASYAEHGSRNPDESLDSVIKRLFMIKGDLTVDWSNRDGFVITMSADELMVPVHLMSGFTLSMLKRDHGLLCSPKPEVGVADGSRTIRAPAYAINRPVEDPEFPSCVLGLECTVPVPFVIRISEGRPVLVSNDAMNSILDVLSVTERTVADIASETGLLEATVHTVLSKLESVGAVSRHRSQGGTVYRSATRALMRVPSSEREVIPSRPFLEDAKVFRECVYDHMMWLINMFGFGSDGISETIGRIIAREVMAMYPDITPQTFLDHACMVHSDRGMDVILESYVPLVLKYHQTRESDRVVENTCEYLHAMMEEALLISTGFRYPVRIDVVRQDP